MARRPVTKPRKNASQERSRSTVGALVDATARILVREGFDKASTNRIAEVAGVSVGSLYQYFPSKESLVIAVIQRHDREIMQIVARALAEVTSLPIEKGVRKLIAAALAAHLVDPKLHRVLAEQIPRTGNLANVEAFNRESHALLMAYLADRRREIRKIDLDLAVFICATSIEALTHTAALHRTDALTDATANTLIDEATRLVVGYLR